MTGKESFREKFSRCLMIDEGFFTITVGLFHDDRREVNDQFDVVSSIDEFNDRSNVFSRTRGRSVAPNRRTSRHGSKSIHHSTSTHRQRGEGERLVSLTVTEGFIVEFL